MRVLHLTTEYPPVIFGGLGTAVGGWVRASAQQGLAVGVLLIEGALVVDESMTNLYGAPVARSAADLPASAVVDREGVMFVRAGRESAIEIGVRIAQQWRPDVIHLHTAMLWWVAQAIRERTGVPLVYHVHSVDRVIDSGVGLANWHLASGLPYCTYDFFDQCPHRMACAKCAFYRPKGSSRAQMLEAKANLLWLTQEVPLTDDERSLLVNYYPGAADRVRIAGNGIEDSALARSASVKPPRMHAPVVLYSGRLVERKGIRELMAAVPFVVARSPAARFVFAGGPPPLTGDEVAAQWLPPELDPYRANLHFTGWLRPKQVAEWYAAADVLVVPSRYEPFGMVILEGMLYGLPVVASGVGGPVEILAHERTGLLFPPRDVGALADSIIRLLEEPQLRQRIGRAAAAEVRTRWAWPALVGTMRQIYEEICVARNSEVVTRRASRRGPALAPRAA